MEALKKIDLYLASSISGEVGTFSALLVYKSNNKIVYGTYDNLKLVELLLKGLSETLKLLKEKCNVKVNVLSYNIVKALTENKSKINEEIKNTAVDEVSKHNIEFILVKEDEPNRIILDRIKKLSKSIIANQIKNEVLKENDKYNYYTRPKEGKVQKIQSEGSYLNDFGYLEGLTNNTREWVIEIINKFQLNLYHSAAATITPYGGKKSLDEIVNAYMAKNKNKRAYIAGNEEKIDEIFKYVYNRLNEKNKI